MPPALFNILYWIWDTLLSPITTIIPILLGIIPVILKMRTDAQIRALNIITKEIVKINDFSIEFLELYKQLKQSTKEITDEHVSTLNILGSKIDYHFQYLENKIKYFPYGIYHFPNTFFSYTIFYNNTYTLFTEYRDCLRMDTIFDGKKEYFNEGNTLIEYPHLTQVDYDDMINCSQKVIESLEEHILSKGFSTLKILVENKLYFIYYPSLICFLTLTSLYIITFILTFFDYLCSIILT